jgi:hypothetical protein
MRTNYGALRPQDATSAYRARFWARIHVRGPDDCWEWTRALSHGYGHCSWADGKVRQAHRIAYALTLGDPGAIHVCHHCDNPPCCNPAHLFLGTDADNVRDMHAKGRYVNGFKRLTEDDVRAIRAAIAAGETQRAVGERHGISHGQVQNIIHRRQWSHVT